VLHQKWEQMRKLILVLRNNKIPKLMTGLNTCMVENSNRRRLKYTPKTHFFQASYKARSLISAAVENVGKLETARWLANTLGVDLDQETVRLFGDMDNRARRHRERKTSFEYTARDLLKQCTESTELVVHQVCAKRNMLNVLPDASDLIDAVTIERYHHDSEAYPRFTDSTIRIGKQLRIISHEDEDGGYASYCRLEERNGELVEVGNTAEFVDVAAVRRGGVQTAKQIIADCLSIAGLTSVRLCDFLHVIGMACNADGGVDTPYYVEGAGKWTETANQFLYPGDFTKRALTADADPAQNTGLPRSRRRRARKSKN
jgi:hypothetical protein